MWTVAGPGTLSALPRSQWQMWGGGGGGGGCEAVGRLRIIQLWAPTGRQTSRQGLSLQQM